MSFLEGVGKGIAGIGTGLGQATSTMAKATADATMLGLDVAQKKEYQERIQKCDDKSVRTDAAELHELMQSDELPILNRQMYEPSIYVSYRIRQIMDDYPKNSDKYNKLIDCMGELNLAEIKYRMARFWPSVASRVLALIVIILVIAFLIFVFTRKGDMVTPIPPKASFESRRLMRPGGF
jgi:hypothetical protein